MFPELAVTGYPPEDLLLRPAFVAAAADATLEIAKEVPDIVQIVGTVQAGRDLHNTAAICAGGEIVAHYFKRHLPNYGVFDEKRYFAPGVDAGPLFSLGGVTFGISICEDIWVPEGPMHTQARAGADLAININASPYHRGKFEQRHAMLATRASDAAVPLVFANLVGGQDELVFDGASMLFDAEGTLLASAPQFEESLAVWELDCTDSFRRRLRDTRPRDWTPAELAVVELGGHEPRAEPSAAPPLRVSPPLDEPADVYAALVTGVRDYLGKNGFGRAVIGLSGGIDSSLTAAVAVDAIGAANVTGIAMPSMYSSGHSVDDARQLAANFEFAFETVPIADAYQAMIDTLAPLFTGYEPDVTEENLQARIRGMIIMAFSNKTGALVLSTGNKSEMATGYATLYGDMAGGFAVIKDVPKMLVYELCNYRNTVGGRELIPQEVIDKPPSAELAPDQFDSDSLPPYEVLDPILEAYVERDMVAAEIVAAGLGDSATVAEIVRLVDRSEYKRRQAPPGVRITPKAFGRDRRLPVTNRS